MKIILIIILIIAAAILSVVIWVISGTWIVIQKISKFEKALSKNEELVSNFFLHLEGKPKDDADQINQKITSLQNPPSSNSKDS